MLDFSISHTRIFAVGATALIVIAAVIVSRMGANFIPSLDEGDLVITLARDPKQGILASVDAQKKVEKTLMEYPEAEKIFSRMGTPQSATDPMGINLADTFVVLKKDRSQWRFSSKDDLFEDMKKKLEELKLDQEISASQPIEMRFNEMLEGSRADVTLRVLGPNLDALFEAIESAEKILKPINGVESVEADPLTALKKSEMLDITPNYTNLSRYGLNLSEVNRYLELAMAGKEVGSFQENAFRFPIVVHLDETLRERQDVIESLPIGLAQGGTVPLSKLASFSLQNRVTTIARSWGERYAALSINLLNRDISSFVKEAQEKVAAGVKLPDGYRLYWGGQFKNLARARLRLGIIVPLTLAVVFLILLKSLGSFSQTMLVFATVPFAAVGGVFSLFIRGIPLSISAAVGFIALIGIALLNAIVLMNVFQQRLAENRQTLSEAVREGALSRLRPVLMTALVASLGFLPMALNTGLGAEVQRPLATVVIGGLVTSTLLTLLLLPGLYIWLMAKRQKPGVGTQTGSLARVP